jgi:uncharacterized membrane protein YoaK (UPF0700 family)
MGLSYVTGTLLSFVEKVADALRASDRKHRWGWAPYILL